MFEESKFIIIESRWFQVLEETKNWILIKPYGSEKEQFAISWGTLEYAFPELPAGTPARSKWFNVKRDWFYSPEDYQRFKQNLREAK